MAASNYSTKHIKESRKKAWMGPQEVSNASCSLYAGTYQPNEEPWSIPKLKALFRIKIIKHDATEMEFDMIGMDPSIANAFRRILLAEVPSMAFEKVGVYNNTTVIPDEVLAHRLGLIPLKADPRLFEYRQEGDTTGTEQDTLHYELKIKCSWNPKRPKDSSEPNEMYLDHNVYSSHIKWIPIGTQQQMYNPTDVGPVHPDILIAKMRPGHEIDLRLEAVKGIPKDHSKFCSVATAFYRLLPEISLTQQVEGEMAERLKDCFSPGVIKIADINGKKIAKVHDARNDACSRNVLRYDDLAKCVTLSRVKDHFIFTIESCGALPPDQLFIEAVKVLKGKTRKFLGELNREFNF